MTKKDMFLIARAIKEALPSPTPTKHRIVRKLSEALRRANPNFNAFLFELATEEWEEEK